MACDCDAQDWQQLAHHFQKRAKSTGISSSNETNGLIVETPYKHEYRLLRFQSHKLLDGQVAIVDQLVCAHAKVFIGKNF